MTPQEKLKLDTIIAKIERLQAQTRDQSAASRLETAKNELLRLWNEKP